jgi:hypothetical protein
MPADLLAAIGRVVVAASSVEDQAGELIALLDGSYRRPSPGPQEYSPALNDWARSGGQLVEAMQKHGVPLAHELSALLERRNEIVHGIVLHTDGSVFATMKRVMVKRSDIDKSAKFKVTEWSIADLLALVADMEKIEKVHSDEISRVMGIPAPRTAVSGEI